VSRSHGVESSTTDGSGGGDSDDDAESASSGTDAPALGGSGFTRRPGISVGLGSIIEPVTGEAAGVAVGAGTPDEVSGFKEGGFCRRPLDDVGALVGDGEPECLGPAVPSSRSADVELEVSTSRTITDCIVHRVTVVAAVAAAAATSVSFTTGGIPCPRRQADLLNVIDRY
jgi:hypothetical protein